MTSAAAWRCAVRPIPAACAAYEEKIREAGGIDLQVLGIGRTGHIGFNEPGSTVESRTRLITLDSVTRGDAASDFFGEWNVPRQAITMGVGLLQVGPGTSLDKFASEQIVWGTPLAAAFMVLVALVMGWRDLGFNRARPPGAWRLLSVRRVQRRAGRIDAGDPIQGGRRAGNPEPGRDRRPDPPPG